MKCLLCDKTELETGQACTHCGRGEDRRLREIRWAWTNLRVAMLPGSTVGQRVSGSREAPLPLRVDPLDLAMPARVPHVIGQLVPLTETRTVEGRHDRVVVTEHQIRDPRTDRILRTDHHIAYLRDEVHRQIRVPLHWLSDGAQRVTPTDDQAGQLAAATILDEWVRDWRWHRDAGESLPPAEVPAMVEWLRIRLVWALDRHPDLPGYSAGIRGLHGALRAAIGDLAATPELCHGVPCKRCDAMALHRTVDGSGDIECGECGRLLTAEDYAAWCRLYAANPRQKAETAA